MNNGLPTKTQQLISNCEITIHIATTISFANNRRRPYTMLNQNLFQAVNGITTQHQSRCKQLILMNNTFIESEAFPFQEIMIYHEQPYDCIIRIGFKQVIKQTFTFIFHIFLNIMRTMYTNGFYWTTIGEPFSLEKDKICLVFLGIIVTHLESIGPTQYIIRIHHIDISSFRLT